MIGIPIKQIKQAFSWLFFALADKEFAKTAKYSTWGERLLLTPIRFYLLGYFGLVAPESVAKMTLKKTGRIDFIVGNTAIEVAVAREGARSSGALTLKSNQPEVTKLLKYDGPSVLVLLDFRRDQRLSKEMFEAYREARIEGKGNHKASSFTVLYFRPGQKLDSPESLQIRPRRRKGKRL